MTVLFEFCLYPLSIRNIFDQSHNIVDLTIDLAHATHRKTGINKVPILMKKALIEHIAFNFPGQQTIELFKVGRNILASALTAFFAVK